MIILQIVLGISLISVGFLFGYLKMKPKVESIREINTQIKDENLIIEEKNSYLKKENSELYLKHLDLINSVDTEEKKYLKIKIENEAAAQKIYNDALNAASDNFERSIQKERTKFLEEVESFQKEIKSIKEEETVNFCQLVQQHKDKINELTEQLDVLRSNVSAAVAAAIRADELKNKEKFYKINLSNEDVKEIQMLKSIYPILKDKEPLNKVIWKVYYENPTSDLIGRVVGKDIVTGIYKITHNESQKCYVGQAVDIASRFKQHIKRGLGAETPTRNKLYPAMFEYGPENFTFEVIEACSKEKLDEREDYWQDYFQAKSFGFSIK